MTEQPIASSAEPIVLADPANPDWDRWLDDLGSVEEDHIFTPVGKQTVEMTRLLNERAAILEEAATGHLSGDTEAAIGSLAAAQVERAVGESYTTALSDIDRRIADQLELDHPNAPRFRLRGLSDDDYTEVRDEIAKLIEGGQVKWTQQQAMVEANLRCVARAVVIPAGATTQSIRQLRKKLNRGEWARLLTHVTALANTDAEATDLPN